MRCQGRIPNGEDLRALVDAFKTFLGFGNCFNRSYPKLFCARCVQCDADALPAVFQAQQRGGQNAAEAEILRTLGRFKETVGLGGSEKIDDGFDADSNGRCEGVLEFQPDFAAYLAAVRGGAERKAFGERKPRPGGVTLGGDLQFVFANELSVVGGRGFDLKGAAGESRIFLQLQRFIFGLRAGGVEEQRTERVARPAVIA